jgi:CubicO group peptidase (beta-lactamase class C family)
MSTQTDRVDKLFEAWDTPESPGCVVGVIHEGELVYVRAYGMADMVADSPLTPGSAFNVQSIAKQFTAACVALLVQDDVIALEDDIRRYVPEFPDYGIPISVRHLVHHTSGIRDYIDLAMLAGKDFRDHLSHADALQIIMRQKSLNFDPGARHVYGNSGYVLLAEIVERVSGTSFGDFAEAHIFRPLGMKDSYMLDRDRPNNVHRVKGYTPNPGGGFEEDPTNFNVKGHGGLVTTIGDLFIWDQNLYDSKIGGNRLLELMSSRGILNTGEETNYAFGLLRGQYKGLENARHSGEWAGIRTDMIRFPEQRFTAICLANLDTVPATRLTRQIADIYLEDEFRLQEFVGEYFNDELQATHQLVLKGSEIYLRFADGDEEPINLRADRFKLMAADARFVRDEDNRITGFTCSTDRVQDIHFVKTGAS